MNPVVTISIVCHNNVFTTKRCLEHLFQHTPFGYELILTDNGSRDATPELFKEIARDKPNVRVIRNEENLGFSEPHRRAYAISRRPYFVMLNNDFILMGRWLEPLMALMESDPRMGVVGVRGTCSGIKRSFEGYRSNQLEYVEASCVMVNRSIIDRLYDGLFAPYLQFAYGEDSDLSLRVREAGYRIDAIDVPHHHEHAKTSSTAAHRHYVWLRQEGNHAILRRRWKVYLHRRTFDYTVLVIRHESHGDVLFVTPIVEALKQKWPACVITVQTNHPEIFESNPCVARATREKLSPKNFDFVFDLDLAYEKRPHLHAVEAYSDVCGVKFSPAFRYRLYPKSYERVRDLDGQRLILIHCGPTTWPGKNWPMDRFEKLAHWLMSDGYSVGTVGSLDNQHLSGTIDLRGTSLDQLAHHCLAATLFVGVDSFPAHVAEAMGCKTLIICGALDAKLRSMSPTTVISAEPKDASCALELHRLPPPQVNAPCQGECMKSIPFERVFNEVQALLKIK